MNHLNGDVKFLKGVGDWRAKNLKKLDIEKIEDIIEHFPRNYINRKTGMKIRELEAGVHSSIVGVINHIEKRKTSNNNDQLNVYISDGVSEIICTWFRFNKWTLEQLQIGKEIWVSGMITQYKSSLQIIHPDMEILEDATEEHEFWKTRNYLPIYPLTAKISIKLLRNLVYNVFSLYVSEIEDNLPQKIMKKYNFLPRKIALQKIHFPTTLDNLETYKAQFIYEELFFQQLMLARNHELNMTQPIGRKFQFKKTYTSKLKKNLPYNLTSAQNRVLREIVSDMNSDYQMNRLLQGDVGSGKTIVTLFAILLAIENNTQAALMAPTEILAEQHFKTISALLINEKISIALLKGGNYKGKKALKEQIANGEIDIIIGTHALIQKDVSFKNIGFVAIDEQHRFGVKQRAFLSQKNNFPDVLYLSATPIPRSLAMTVFGDLEVSIIDELPPNRKPIKTFWRSAGKINLVYQEVKKQLLKGQQIYIVCPLISESEKIDLLSAETLFEELDKNIFKEFHIALLHGKMKNKEKDTIMAAFKSKKIDILISTTVIEVGIDIPNASVMIIEHSERFGLSQLHQLRGRVGRGSSEAFCYLISYPPVSREAKERLSTMVKTNDGFEIAEKDLEIRGPGDFFGTIQSGMPRYKHANILRDQDILKMARKDAFEIVKEDYNFIKPENKELKKFYERNYLEREKLHRY